MATCSTPKNCSQNLDYENCGQVTNALYQNYGCKRKDSATSDYFECTNRKDKPETYLFGNPPVPTKKAYQAPNYNLLLEFDEVQIYCGSRNVSYKNFRDLIDKFGDEDCLLKNNQTIKMSRLYIGLKTDFSFLHSPTLDQYQ